MKNFKRVLFVGNSITHHMPAPILGWNGDWGMAASSRDKDYVHCIMEELKKYNPEVEFMYRNIAKYELKFWEYDLDEFKELRDFNADIIIMRIAENVVEEDAKLRGFEECYSELIRYLNPCNMATVVCTNCFWPKENVSMQIKKVAEQNNYIFADIDMLRFEEDNMAKKEYMNEGVGSHPSDRGMRTIADIILSSLRHTKFI